MAKSARRLVVALVAVFAASGVSFADTNVDVAASWGLLGTWRLDCTAQPSRSDPDLNFVVRAGKLFHDRNWGDGSDSSAVVAASRTADGGLLMTVRFDSLKQTRQWAYTKRDDDHIRAISNRNTDTDEYSIRDGKFTANGKITPWQTRCR